MTNAAVSELPTLPEKRYFTIGETAKLCAVKPHVLRYWEQEFTMLKPVKRRGSRRYYQQKDVEMVRQIRELLYNKGFTIQGARQQLKEPREAIEPVKVAMAAPVVAALPAPKSKPISQPAAMPEKQFLSGIISQLEQLLMQLKA